MARVPEEPRLVGDSPACRQAGSVRSSEEVPTKSGWSQWTQETGGVKSMRGDETNRAAAVAWATLFPEAADIRDRRLCVESRNCRSMD